jgi:hypothetical protein
MKKKKAKNPKLTEPDGLQAALETLMQRKENERKELRPKQQRLFKLLAQQKGGGNGMPKQIKHKAIKFSDLIKALGGEAGMKRFLAGAKMAFGPPAPSAPPKKEKA